MPQEQVWEQAVHAILGAAIELGHDVDKIAEKAKLIMSGNEVYRFVGHDDQQVTRTISSIDEVAEQIKTTFKNKP